MSESRLKQLLRHAQQIATNDPRKSGVLGALLLILAFMIVRTVANMNSQPNAAHASHSNLHPDQPGHSEQEPATGNDATPVIRWLSTAPPVMSRNLFAIDPEIFPTELTKSDEDFETQGFWDDIAKSMNLRADQQGRKQEIVQRIQSQAKALQVTSVMMGLKPQAVINGELVGEGDVVASFRVLKIEARRIVVEREGIRLEIQMN